MCGRAMPEKKNMVKIGTVGVYNMRLAVLDECFQRQHLKLQPYGRFECVFFNVVAHGGKGWKFLG